MNYKIYFLAMVILTFATGLFSQESGSFTDSRDGKIYKTVKIGTQTWMAENLAFKIDIGCWAYDNDQNNVSTYGYLYTWSTAKNVCPSGWHLPSVNEWDKLFSSMGGTGVAGGKLKEKASGFTALLGGQCNSGNGENYYQYIGSSVQFWTSSSANDGAAFLRTIGKGNSIGFGGTTEPDKLGISVRCIKND